MSVHRLRPEQRREQVVAAARGVIAEQGLAFTSLRDIARAAGVSIGTVTYHFESVDEILGAVAFGETQRFYAAVIDRVDATADAREALALLVGPMFDESTDLRAHWQIWSDYWAVVARRPGIARAYEGRMRSWEECCARTIERGVAAGRFRPVDPHLTATKLAAYADGIGAQLAQGAPGVDAATAVTWMAELVDLLL